MSVKEFWEEDPDLFWAYRFSYFERLKMQQETFNHNAWLQGAYVYDALSVSLCNAFSKTKVNYPELPYGVKHEEPSLEEQQKALTEQITNRAKEVQSIMKGKNNQQVIIGKSRV